MPNKRNHVRKGGFPEANTSQMWPRLSLYYSKYPRDLCPGKYRPVQYHLSGKYREILGNINILLVFCVTCIFNGVLRAKYQTILP